MTIRDRLRAAFTPVGPTILTAPSGPSATYALGREMPEYRIGRPEWPTWNASAYTDTYSKLALVYRCLNLIAHFVGTAPVRVYDETDDEHEAISDHPLRALLKRPNPEMGEAAFWGAVALRSGIAGFCVCEIVRDARTGQPVELWPLNSSWLKPIPQRNSAPDWQYKVPGHSAPYILKAEDAINFKWADTPSGYACGSGPLEACLREIAISSDLMDFLKRFLETGAVPITGLIPDTLPGQRLSQTQVEDMATQFIGRRAGIRNAARPWVMEGIKDVKRLGFDMNELAYVDLRDLSELAIVQAFGIPPTIAQIRVGLEHSDSRANAEVDEGKFYRLTIIPWWARQDDVLTLRLLPEFESNPAINLEFDTSKIEALQEDRNAKAQWVNTAVNAGWLSAHAAADLMGIKRPDGVNFFIRYLSAVAIDATDPLGEQGAVEVAPTPTQVEPGAETPALPAGTEGELAAAKRTLKGIGPRARLARADRSRQLVRKIAQSFDATIDKHLTQQAARLAPVAVRGLLAGLGPTEQYGLNEVDWNKETERTRTVLRQLHILAGKSAFEAADQFYGIDAGIAFDQKNPRVQDVIDLLGSKIVRITDETRALISKRIADGLDAGLNADDIADTIRGMYQEFYKGRSLTIARTETTHAYGEASVLAFKESGVSDRAQIFDNPEHTEDYGASDGLTCASRNGIIVPLDQAMDHVYADHPNGSVVMAPVLTGETE